MQKIKNCLWFNTEAEEAANFYISIFKNSKITRVLLCNEAAAQASGQPKDSVWLVEFELDGQPFLALNGGPDFKFTPAISFIVDCHSQEEIDHYWDRLSAVPEAEACGWLCDKFGISWQIVPSEVVAMVSDPDPAKSQRATLSLMEMKKLNIVELRRAYEQEN